MRGIWAVPIIVSILIIGTLTLGLGILGQPVLADTPPDLRVISTQGDKVISVPASGGSPSVISSGGNFGSLFFVTVDPNNDIIVTGKNPAGDPIVIKVDPVTGSQTALSVNNPNGYLLTLITHDGTNLYFTGQGTPGNPGLFSMSLSGGTITLLYSSFPNSLASGGGTFGITVLGSDIFWIDPNAGSGTATAIFKAPKDGSGPITTVCSGCGMVDGADITTDGTKLYIAEEFGGKVLAMNPDGSGLVGLGNNRFPTGFAAETFWTLAEHDGIVYLSDRADGTFVTDARIQSIPVTGGTYTTLHEESRLTFSPLGTAILHPEPEEKNNPCDALEKASENGKGKKKGLERAKANNDC